MSARPGWRCWRIGGRLWVVRLRCRVCVGGRLCAGRAGRPRGLQGRDGGQPPVPGGGRGIGLAGSSTRAFACSRSAVPAGGRGIGLAGDPFVDESHVPRSFRQPPSQVILSGPEPRSLSTSSRSAGVTLRSYLRLTSTTRSAIHAPLYCTSRSARIPQNERRQAKGRSRRGRETALRQGPVRNPRAQASATTEEIREARNRLIKRYHPDKGGLRESQEDREFWTARTAEINDAWDILKDSQTRSEYDRQRLAKGSQPGNSRDQQERHSKESPGADEADGNNWRAGSGPRQDASPAPSQGMTRILWGKTVLAAMVIIAAVVMEAEFSLRKWTATGKAQTAQSTKQLVCCPADTRHIHPGHPDANPRRLRGPERRGILHRT